MADVRLAFGGGMEVAERSMGCYREMPAEQRPAMLVSYVYLPQFERHRHRFGFRDWVLDSGAFTAHMSGQAISLPAYIDTCKRLRDSDDAVSEIFALDVIGDWKASVKNTEAMWKAGVPAIPCFHFGEPWELLRDLCRDYPKVAIGGVAKAHKKQKITFAEQCFARTWPKRLHGFGFGHKEHILALPWHSVDASSWTMGPSKYGRWNAFGVMSVRGAGLNVRADVEHYLAIERESRARFKKELQVLAALPT